METIRPKRLQAELISFITLRRAVGILGILLPFIMVIGSVGCGGCQEIQSSICAYYHTNMRNIYIGIICAIAFFLYAYKGYNIADDICGDLACVFALGVAFFPTSVTGHPTSCIPNTIDNGIIGLIHNVSAGGFFLVLTFFSLFLFTKTDKHKAPTCMKKKRNAVYITTGIFMIACMILILILFVVDSYWVENWTDHNAVFWLESIALFSFGISWFIKGRTLFSDDEENQRSHFPMSYIGQGSLKKTFRYFPSVLHSRKI